MQYWVFGPTRKVEQMKLIDFRARLAALPPEADQDTVALTDSDGRIYTIESVRHAAMQHFEGLPDEVGSGGTTWIEVDEI